MKKLILVILIIMSINVMADDCMDNTYQCAPSTSATTIVNTPIGPTADEVAKYKEEMATIYFKADKVYLNGMNVTNCLYGQICYNVTIALVVGFISYITLTNIE